MVIGQYVGCSDQIHCFVKRDIFVNFGFTVVMPHPFELHSRVLG